MKKIIGESDRSIIYDNGKSVLIQEPDGIPTSLYRISAKPTFISICAETIPWAWQKAVLACYEYGVRVETPKHQEGMSLGYDADINIYVEKPFKEPRFHKLATVDAPLGQEQYRLELLFGIHDYWVKEGRETEVKTWGYTYHQRFKDQIPLIIKRIKEDLKEKDRISGRDYQFTTWIYWVDTKIDDPPCLQRGHLRLLKDKNSEWVLSFTTSWRSRCLAKGWWQNVVMGTTELQRLLAIKISKELGFEIKTGAYLDKSNSLHLYGAYFDKDNFKEKVIDRMQKGPLENLVINLEDYMGDRKGLRRIIAAQTDADKKGLGKNLPENRLRELGYDLDNYPYPKEWDI